MALSSASWSQNIQTTFKGVVRNTSEGTKEHNVIVSVIQKGDTIDQTYTSRSGKYNLETPCNFKEKIEVHFNKPGYVGKFVTFDLKNLLKEDMSDTSEFRPLESLDLDLFKEIPTADFSFLESAPIAKFYWDVRSFNVAFDNRYTSNIRKKIEAVLEAVDDQELETQYKYEHTIEEADKNFELKHYDRALMLYEEALEMYPSEVYPKERIEEIRSIFSHVEDEMLSKLEAYYQKELKIADSLFEIQKYQAAKKHYRNANNAKPSEQYPRERITEVEYILVDWEQNQRKKAIYEELISKGDEQLLHENYKEALKYFEEAFGIDPKSDYALQQIKFCREKIK